MPCGGGNCLSCKRSCVGSVSCLGGPPLTPLNYGPSCCGPCSIGVPSVPIGWNPVSMYVGANPVPTPYGVGSPCCTSAICPYQVPAWVGCCNRPYA